MRLPYSAKPAPAATGSGPQTDQLGGSIGSEANQTPEFLKRDPAAPKRKSWREVLPVHPAAELFPLLSKEELKGLSDDIKKHGIRTNLAVWESDEGRFLLDGRNRLDAAEMAGLLTLDEYGRLCLKTPDGPRELRFNTLSTGQTLYKNDPYSLVCSFNIHRRHLTAEQRREIIAKLLKADAERSDRSIGKLAKADHKTVAAERAKQEACGEIPHTEVRKDGVGKRKQAARKRARRKAREQAEKRKQQEALNELRADYSDEAIDSRTTATARRFFDRLGLELSRFIVDETSKNWEEYIPIINKLEKLVEAAGAVDQTDVERTADARKAEDTSPNGPQSCAQCGGHIDGKERPVRVAGEAVWLHPECKPFWAKGDGWGLRR